MKILQILPSTIRGGAEEYALTTAIGFVEKGAMVQTAFPSRKATEALADDFSVGGVAVVPLEVPAEKCGLLTTCRQILRTARRLATFRPDVVHMVLPYPNQSLGSLLACALCGVPAVVVFQLTTGQFLPSRAVRRFSVWAKGRRQSWVAISEHNRELLGRQFGVPKGQISVIYNGPCRSPEQPLADEPVAQELLGAADRTVILTVGRLHPQKGYDLLVKAIPQLIEYDRKVLFVWVGDGGQRAELEAMIEASGIGDFVMLIGYRDDVQVFLRRADIFLFPTRYEGGSSIALLEAMQAGVPVVSSRASGIPEVIDDRVHGLLFDVDDVGSLVAAVSWALEHPEEMRRMAVQARERVEDFSADKMVAATFELLTRNARADC